jgi:hypothetical protein
MARCVPQMLITCVHMAYCMGFQLIHHRLVHNKLRFLVAQRANKSNLVFVCVQEALRHVDSQLDTSIKYVDCTDKALPVAFHPFNHLRHISESTIYREYYRSVLEKVERLEALQ